MNAKTKSRARGPRGANGAGERLAATALASTRSGPPIDAQFFLTILPLMVSSCEACGEEGDHQVLLHLADGAVLDVRRIVGVSPRLVVLAAFAEGPEPDGSERTSDKLMVEAVPFELLVRATVRRMPRKTARFGFSVETPSRLPGTPSPGEPQLTGRA